MSQKHLVINAFQDKFTGVHYPAGTHYTTENPKRILFLQEEGFLEETTLPEGEGEGSVKHVGGGYYELPNGEKVKGKENALAALNEQE
jgi:hypothetical protein